MKSLRHKNQTWVHFQGKIFKLEKAKSNFAGEDAATDDLVAPFSCKVLKVHTSNGSTLAKGDLVVTVEAMKMEYSYYSPRDGEVDTVKIKEGQVINAGTQFIHWAD